MPEQNASQINDVISQLQSRLPDNLSIKTTHKRAQIVQEFITTQMLMQQFQVKHAIESGENVSIHTYFEYFFACGHKFSFEQNNIGMVTFEPPVVASKKVKNHYRRFGEIIVCRDCVRVCGHCGQEVTLLTSYFKDRQYLCSNCAPGGELRAFFSWLNDFGNSGGAQ